MKKFIISVFASLLLLAGFSNTSFAQDRWRDRDGNWHRNRVRAHITIGTPAVRVNYSNYPRRYYYREHYYYTPSRRVVYYNEDDRYWVPGYYDAYGNWISGHWEFR